MVLDDLIDLWNINITNYSVGAIPDTLDYDANHKKILEIPESATYFNVGVMLINLNKWRESNIEINAFQYIKNHKNIRFRDQDILNILLHDKCILLPPAFNAMVFSPNTAWYKEQKKVYIVHFICANKPWLLWSKHPFKKRYYFYLRKTPWKLYIPRKFYIYPDITYTNIKYSFLNKYPKIFNILRYAKKPFKLFKA